MARGQGRGRIGLVFEEWPSGHQTAWNTAIADGDVFDGRGPAAHWAIATRKTNVNQYGRWLAYLRQTDRLVGNALPESLVRPETVGEYVRHLQAVVAPRTVVTLLVALKVTIKAMAPSSNWRWLADICNALNRSAKPVTDKHSRIRASQEIYGAAVAELDRLLALPPGGRNRLCAYRNTLMIALMAARPLRLKNFAALEMGHDFLRNGAGWLIAIPGDAVKNGRPLEFDVTESLVPYIENYLREIRPRLMGDSGPSNDLWVAWAKPDISQREVHQCFICGTTRLLGAPINPHLFRDCAATSLSLVSTAAARAAAPLLGHQQFATTERHYVRAQQLEASRTLNTVISSIKSSVR